MWAECNIQIPAQVLLVNKKNSSSGHCGRSGCPQVTYLKQQSHGGGERNTFITGQSQDLKKMWSCHVIISTLIYNNIEVVLQKLYQDKYFYTTVSQNELICSIFRQGRNLWHDLLLWKKYFSHSRKWLLKEGQRNIFFYLYHLSCNVLYNSVWVNRREEPCCHPSLCWVIQSTSDQCLHPTQST